VQAPGTARCDCGHQSRCRHGGAKQAGFFLDSLGTDLNILNALYLKGAMIMPVPEVEPENDEPNAILEGIRNSRQANIRIGVC